MGKDRVPARALGRKRPAQRQRYDVFIVGGLGHVGLPLGIVLADAGLQVALYDIDKEKRQVVASGRMPFLEHDAGPLLKKVIGRSLHVLDKIAEVAQAEHVVITVGTPVDEYMNPKQGPLLSVARELVPHLREGHRIILRSTVCPGTTTWLARTLEGMGARVEMAYCPERIVQGQAVRELRTFPQIVSGCTEPAARAAERLFQRLGIETVRVEVAEAELAKLYSNTWRYIQFATVNEFYRMALEAGADFDRIYHAMTHNYQRAKSLPRPGFAAGPCLLKDTWQLIAGFGNHFPLGQAAVLANEGLPHVIVDHLRNDLGINVRTTRVGILGMAFKADIDDIRDSLSYKLAKLLRFHGAEVVCSDEYVQDSAFVTKERLLATCPVVIVGVPHSAYRSLSAPNGAVLIDLWGIIEPSTPGHSATPPGLRKHAQLPPAIRTR